MWRLTVVAEVDDVQDAVVAVNYDDVPAEDHIPVAARQLAQQAEQVRRNGVDLSPQLSIDDIPLMKLQLD